MHLEQAKELQMFVNSILHEQVAGSAAVGGHEMVLLDQVLEGPTLEQLTQSVGEGAMTLRHAPPPSTPGSNHVSRTVLRRFWSWSSASEIEARGWQIPHSDSLPEIDPETGEEMYWVLVEDLRETVYRRRVRPPALVRRGELQTQEGSVPGP